MSADNWTLCPRCTKESKAKKEQQIRDAGLSYGKVPKEKYAELISIAQEPLPIHDTLREDYEIGISRGEFYVSYSGYCDKCKFGFTFKHTEKITF